MDTNATTSGASNASDFQPLTRNPQSAPAQLFQQQGGLQTSGSQDVLQNGTAKITVPVNPAPAPVDVSEAKDSSWLMFSLIVVVVVAVFLLWRRRRAKAPLAEESVSSKLETPEEADVTLVVPAKSPRSPKAIAKAKRSKKRKRTRR